VAIAYAIYRGDATGGPADFTAAYALVTGGVLTYDTPALAPGERRRYAVRAVDLDSGLVDLNTDAVVRIAVDADGLDTAARPDPVTAVTVTPASATTAIVGWTRLARPGSPEPTGFYLWVTSGGGATNYALAPDQTLGTFAEAHGTATITGLVAGTDYRVAVRAFNAAGDDGGTADATFTTPAGPPLAPQAATASASFGA
jgi:hypothetical protein